MFVIPQLTVQVASDGNGVSALNQLSGGGLGLLHLFAALGWEWGIAAVLLAGASVDLRDAQGRTALHWAAPRGHVVGLIDHSAAITGC